MQTRTPPCSVARRVLRHQPRPDDGDRIAILAIPPAYRLLRRNNEASANEFVAIRIGSPAMNLGGGGELGDRRACLSEATRAALTPERTAERSDRLPPREALDVVDEASGTIPRRG